VTLEYKGRGDPRRSMALLWRRRREPTRGPKPTLTVEQIIAAAVEIADAEGLAAVTIRRVAQRLNVGAMTLYTYIPGKAELLDIMLDEVYGESLADMVDRRDWRTRLEVRARRDWERYQNHPWMLQISEARSLLGPNEIALYESALASVSGLGLTGREMISIVSLVTSYVRGAAQVAVDAAGVGEKTGVSDDQWWAERAPILDEYYDLTRYPTLASIDLEDGLDEPLDGAQYHLQLAIESFVLGLQRVLDVIGTFINDRAVDQTFPPPL
jgi:AcrR family transcriptional regulator